MPKSDLPSAGRGPDRAGQRIEGDEGALELRVPAVGAVHPARDGLEIEEGAELLERVRAGLALGPAAVADHGDGGLDVLHDSTPLRERKQNKSYIARCLCG